MHGMEDRKFLGLFIGNCCEKHNDFCLTFHVLEKFAVIKYFIEGERCFLFEHIFASVWEFWDFRLSRDTDYRDLRFVVIFS